MPINVVNEVELKDEVMKVSKYSRPNRVLPSFLLLLLPSILVRQFPTKGKYFRQLDRRRLLHHKKCEDNTHNTCYVKESVSIPSNHSTSGNSFSEGGCDRGSRK